MAECFNLRAEMARKQLEIKKMATEIGMSEKTLINKIKGKSDFTWGQTGEIRDKYFPGADREYLFARDSELQQTGA